MMQIFSTISEPIGSTVEIIGRIETEFGMEFDDEVIEELKMVGDR